MNFIQELDLLLKSKYPIIYVNSCEEERLEYTIGQFVTKKFSITLLYWDFVEGYQGNPNYYSIGSRNPAETLDFINNLSIPCVIILRDFNLFLNDNSIIRRLKNLYRSLRSKSITIIITSIELKIPTALKEIIAVLNFPLPDKSQINEEIIRIFDKLDYPIDSLFLNNLTQSCKGLSLEKVRKIFCKILTKYGKIEPSCLDLILIEKKNQISQTHILEFLSYKSTMSDIGGLKNLKKWLMLRSYSFSEQANLYGLPSPKGLLLAGIQGTGKSLVAKVIANEWDLPLLRLDIGKLFAGIIGESEFRVREMIEVAESLAPCILWIDEIDKGFFNPNFINDSGTTSRVFATFITWLSEKTSSVFIVATTNNIYSLPSELLRKGRFDEIFFIGLPSQMEREEIFSVHLSRVRPNSWKNYDIQSLSSLSDKFSGAEIKQSIIEAMHTAFYERREFCTNDICIALKNIIPLAYSHSEELTIIENLALSGKIRQASDS
uniref:Uncharacterized AAA domain-containing protein ycf46 n=1 Tax=Boldia erythrosiphon TaxID=74908 RepID=A0A1X9PTL6_9RHOD|nr:conserved hypothetical plastid protein [Boldia erythrosiphon]ARO90679.1 conserved hypothetical plastid protein [Boldia erythrosiphon]